MKRRTVFHPDYDFFTNLPSEKNIFNPLTDISVDLRERDQLVEFCKLCNEYYSPSFGIKYVLNTQLYPYQMAIILAMLRHKFPMLLLSRGGSKTFLLAVFATYMSVFFPGIRIILISAGFRQSKLIFAEIKKIWERAPLLQALSSGPPAISVGECHFYVGESTIKALPLGQGDKIRGERANVTLTDEFNSIPKETFDIVVRGFAATEMNPFEKTKNIMLGRDNRPMDDGLISHGNKIVLSGTAGFKNETFYRMYKQYTTILSHRVRGYASEYEEALGADFLGDERIDYRDYCIIRMKYTDLPPGLMDTKMIHNARATMTKMLFDMEYNTLFGDDTVGYFKQKDINEATAKSPGGFCVSLFGNPKRQYVIGVDPARTTDRAAVVLVELGTPNKIRYVWSCQGEKYSNIAKKIREIMANFKNVIGISMDKGGGGLAVQDILSEPAFLEDDEKLIFDYQDESDKTKQGLRILYMVQFAPAWLDEANSLLQKNIEDKAIMFPMKINKPDLYINKKIAEEADDALFEIEEMKKELVSIEVTYNKNGTRRYDLMPPSSEMAPGEVARHKDRYSALLLANYLACRFTTLNFDEKEEMRKKYKDSAIGGWIEEFEQ